MKQFFVALIMIALPMVSMAQTITKAEFDSLKAVVFDVQSDLHQIDLNLQKAEKRLKTGILVSTIGYTVTIIGGQLLGGPNNDVGEVLLYTGGAVGIGGTILLVDGFKFFNRQKIQVKRAASY